MVLAFCAGTGLYLLRRLTSNLWVAMGVHALRDFSSLALGLGQANAGDGAVVFLGCTYAASLALVTLVLRRAQRPG